MSINLRKLTLGLIICLLFIAIISSTYYLMRPDHKLIKPSENTIPVVYLEPIKEYTIPQTVSSYGTTISPDSVILKSQIAGIITTIQFKPGEQVKKGQILFSLISNDISNQTKKLYAQMLSSKSLYDRQRKANQLTPGTVSDYQLEKTKLQYQQDLATYNESHAVDLVRAPTDGIVSATDLAVGSYVNAGEILTQLVDTHSLQIQYQLPSDYANQVRQGQTIRFYAKSIHPYLSGKVVYIAPMFNKQTYNLTLRANIKQLSEIPLKAQLFGRVEQVINPNFKTLAVPQALAQTDAKGFYVLTIDKDKVEKVYFNP